MGRNLSTFERQLELDDAAATVFRWHARPGAFERLVPPWEEVRLMTAPAPLVSGARQAVSVALGPLGSLRVTWRSEIEQVDEGRGFRDVQLSGPFAHWRHEHIMQDREAEDREGGGSLLRDRITYALPLGPLGALFGSGITRRKLQRMFAYRHAVTRRDLELHRRTADTPPLDVLVSGASGMVGRSLCAFLSGGGHRVRRLVRRAPRGPDEYRWDALSGAIDPRAAEGADAVIHLAGENIAARRWSPAQKDRIRRSRVEGTRHVADAVRAARKQPRVFLSASAIGIYGDRDDELLDENSTAGEGFLADVCRAWEANARNLGGPRTVELRFGAILSPRGGALAKMLLPFKLGAGGRLGDGRQWMSWIALDDVIGAIHHALLTPALRGPVNVVAPNPVQNFEFTRKLGRVLRRPTLFPMPGLAARLAFGELADELLLASQRVMPLRLLDTGYAFAQPELEGALRHQLGRTQ